MTVAVSADIRRLPHDPHTLQGSRVLALSTLLAVHVLAALVLSLPTQPLAPPPPARDLIVVPQRMDVPPPPPPPPQRVPVATKPAPQAVPRQERTPDTPRPPPTQTQTAASGPPEVVDAAPQRDPPPAGAGGDHSGQPDGDPAAGIGMQLQLDRAPPPPYPPAALRNGWEGEVVLMVTVDAMGRPIDVRIERSSGQRLLDQAARSQVLRQWRFKPALRDGVAVPAIGRVPVRFSLDD